MEFICISPVINFRMIRYDSYYIDSYTDLF